MRVLDAGCGPGTITRGLARAVTPGGSCTGVDGEASQIELARAHVDAMHGNLTFEVASIYRLPFAAASFDAVLSHAVFEHLARPHAALAELRRVLRPGGVVGVCSSDWSDAQIDPRGEDVDVALRCHLLLRRKAGGDPYAGARLPGWVAAAGFLELEVDARASRRHAVPHVRALRRLTHRGSGAARSRGTSGTSCSPERPRRRAGPSERRGASASPGQPCSRATPERPGRRNASSPSRR